MQFEILCTVNTFLWRVLRLKTFVSMWFKDQKLSVTFHSPFLSCVTLAGDLCALHDKISSKKGHMTNGMKYKMVSGALRNEGRVTGLGFVKLILAAAKERE